MTRKGKYKFSSLGTTGDSVCDKVREDDFNDEELIRVLHPQKSDVTICFNRNYLGESNDSPSRDNISLLLVASAFCY
jgi:hypothetical protein